MKEGKVKKYGTSSKAGTAKKSIWNPENNLSRNDEAMMMDDDMDMSMHEYNMEEKADCGCRFYSQPSPRMQYAHSYVPWQYYERAFTPAEALHKGTLFPELYFCPKLED